MSINWMTLVIAIVYYPFGVLLLLTNSLRVAGMRRIPRTGPVLLISNHQSSLDIILAGLISHRRVYFLARRNLWSNRILAWIMDRFETTAVDTEGFSRSGLEGVLEQLRKGRVVVVYPEGQRTRDGRLAELRPGVSLLVRKVKAPIVPIGIAGAYETFPRHSRFWRLAPPFLNWFTARIAVFAGRPIDGNWLGSQDRGKILQILTEHLSRAVQSAERLRRTGRR